MPIILDALLISPQTKDIQNLVYNVSADTLYVLFSLDSNINAYIDIDIDQQPLSEKTLILIL